ncbi:hypothetical protein GCM10007989_07330 [Devosia pacifica]|uniref:Phage tail lysozyme domain-containing protein n=1 Tax=Devosia pacifica TaxID=1335967 RepID=A0A918RXD4_9HYPH|nr:phage tail tip lysozyme [Devosia pacifica]GHA15111.1 hypothetical protein GCM10007989_07330 [Devosia pacifica]
MATGNLFSFDANRETPEDVKRRRALAEAIMGRNMAPQNVGEGFAAIAQGIVANVNNSRANAAERAGQARSSALRDRLIASITGSGNDGSQYVGPTTPPATAGKASTQISGASLPQGERATYIREGLVSRGLPEHVADAFVLNFRDESGLDPGINERNPIVPGSRGGYGLYQLTGPRRRAYEAFAQQRGVDPSDVDAQLDFLMTELEGPEARAAQSILGASDTGTAAAAIVRDFLRPAPEHRDRRASAYLSGDYPGQRTRVASANPSALPPLAPPSTATPEETPQQPSIQIDPVQPRGAQPQATAPQQPMPQAQAPRPQAAPQQQQRPMQTAQAGGLASIPIEDAFALMGDVWSEENQALGEAILNAHLQQQDPAYRQELQMNDLRMQQLQQQVGEGNYQARPLSQAEMEDWGLPPGSGSWVMGPDNTPVQLYASPAPAGPDYDFEQLDDGTYVRIDRTSGEVTPMGNYAAPEEPGFSTVTLQLPDGSQRTLNTADPAQAQQANDLMAQGAIEAKGSLVDINMPGETANNFFTGLGETERKNYEAMLTNGQNAGRTLAQLDQLEGLLADTPQGFEAAATSFAGNFGIDLGGASGVQAAQALINQMVPSQRPPGSGPMSDADLELFKQSVPRLINQPGGNELIIRTMRDINRYDQALANLVQEYTWRGESARTAEEAIAIRREMRGAIAELQNPMENFNDRIEGYRREAPQAPPAQQPMQSPANPEITDGTIIENDQGQRMVLRGGRWVELM